MGKYSETMMGHVLSPRNGGVMEHADLTDHAGHARSRGVSDSFSQSGRGPDHCGQVSHGRLWADDRLWVDFVGAGFGAVDGRGGQGIRSGCRFSKAMEADQINGP